MNNAISVCYGELAPWPAKKLLVKALREAGLQIYVGRYSVRIENCQHFIFQEYGGDLGDPQLEAEADTVEKMERDVRLVASALEVAGIGYHFEVCNSGDEPVLSLDHEARGEASN